MTSSSWNSPQRRLEDRLLAGLADVILELGLREVVHLLDPGRMDPAVLDQLLERRPRDLAAEAVEGREDDRLRRVVDDEVDAGQVLERADVAALAADDPALHVVRRELDDGDGRLGRVARGDPLERVGDQRPRAPPRLRPRLLLLLADAPRELVPDQVLRALEQVALRLRDGQPADPLELAERLVLRRLQLLLELLDVHLAVVQALVAALDLRLLPRDLVLGGRDLLLDPGGLGAPLLHLGLDLRPQLDRELARLDLRLAPDRLRLALGDVDARPAAEHQQRRRHGGAESESDERRNRSEHAVLPPEGEGGFRDEASRVLTSGAGLHGRAPVLARQITLEPAVPPGRPPA